MMYWIVFAFFTTAETLTDIVLSWAERCPVYGVFMAMDERLNETQRRKSMNTLLRLVTRAMKP